MEMLDPRNNHSVNNNKLNGDIDQNEQYKRASTASSIAVDVDDPSTLQGR